MIHLLLRTPTDPARSRPPVDDLGFDSAIWLSLAVAAGALVAGALAAVLF